MKNYFERYHNGYGIFSNVLSISDCDAILAGLPNSGNNIVGAGSRGLFENDVVKKIARDKRVMSIAREFFAADPIPFKATLFNKTSVSNWLVVWHQDRVLPIKKKVDSPDWGPWTVKSGVHFAQAPAWAMGRIVALRIHLDDSTEDNGPLKVIPGSHALGILDQKDVLDIAGRSTPTTLTASKGSVIAMRPLLIHASGKVLSDKPRRVLHIEYADSLSLADGFEIAFC